PIWPKTAPAGLAYYSAEEVAPAGAAQAYIRVVPSHSSGSPGTTTFYNLRLRPMSGSTLIEPGAVTTEKLTVTSDMSAAIVNAMTTNTKKLVVTEEAILNHATLIGQTVVDNINVQGKLIGTDGVFTGTVDFANVNVTGSVLADKIAGNTISAVTLEGSTISTSTSGVAPEVRLHSLADFPVITMDDGQTAVPGTITTGAGDPYRSTSAGGAPGSVSINAGGPVDAPYSRLTVAESNANLTAFRPSDGAQGSLQLFPARAQLYTYNSGTATDGGELDISPNRLNISLAGTGGGSSSIAMGQRAINNTQ